MNAGSLGAITDLNASYNSFRNVFDLTSYTAAVDVDLSGNALLTGVNLNTTANDDLRILRANDTGIVTLDVSGYDLAELYLKDNKQLTTLNASGNDLTVLDLAGSDKLVTIDASGNQLETFNAAASVNTLKSLKLGSNLFEGELDLAGYKALTTLDVSNNKIDSLVLTGSAATLDNLNASTNSFVGTFDLTPYSALATANLGGNELIGVTLDKVANAALRDLNLSNNKIAALDVSGYGLTALNLANNVDLATLDARGNDLASLVLTGDNKIVKIDASGNELSAFDASASAATLTDLNLSDNNFAGTLNLAAYTAIEKLDVSKNQISTLNAAGSVGTITDLNASDNAFTGTFDLTPYVAAAKADLSGNELTGITVDPTANAPLRELDASSNKFVNLAVTNTGITKLDLSDNPDLVTLDASGNALTSLVLTGDTKLGTVNASGNDLASFDASASADTLATLNLSDNAFAGALNLSAYKALASLDVSQNGITSLDASGSAATLATLNASDNGFAGTFELTPYTALANADLSGNALTGIVLDPTNVALKVLDASDNNFVSLDLSGHGLSSLNLSDNADLTTLNVSDNALTALTLTNNAKIQTIDAGGNALTAINASDSADTLKTLILDDNLFTGPLNLTGYKALTKLDASKNAITSIAAPDSKGTLADLNLSDNSFAGLLDLTGFTALTALDVSGNTLTGVNAQDSADSIAKLNLADNAVTGTLDLDGYSALTDLDVSGNLIATLDASDSAATLAKLNASDNAFAGAFDLTPYTALAQADLSGNDITGIGLDKTKNAALRELDASDNKITALAVSGYGLTALNVSNNADLETLDASDNDLAALDLTGNGKIKTLDASGNALTTFNAAASVATLETLDLGDNAFAGKLDLAAYRALTELDVSKNQIDELDASGSVGTIKKLNVSENALDGALDLSGYIALTDLDVSGNTLTAVDASDSATTIENLKLADNSFAGPLDLTGYSALKTLDLSKNLIDSITVPGSLGTLTGLNASQNAFTGTFDLTPYTALAQADLSGNTLTNLTIDPIVNAPLRSLKASSNKFVNLDVSDLGLTALDLSDNKDLETLDASGNDLASLVLSGSDKLKTVDASGNELVTVDVSKNPALETLDVSDNKLTTISLGAPADSALRVLDASGNAFTALDVKGYTKLEELDLSDNAALTTLDASGNGLTKLDLTGNAALESLKATGNKIANLDLSDSHGLKTLDVSGNPIVSLVLPDDVVLDNAVFTGSNMPLSELYDFILKHVADGGSVQVGNQIGVDLSEVSDIPATGSPVPGFAYDLSSEATLGAAKTPTVFTVTYDNVAAVSGTDYAIADGKLTFLDRGAYQIAMTNPEVHNTGTYGTDVATATSSVLNVLPAGAEVSWNGAASAIWGPKGTVGSGKDWLYTGTGVNAPAADVPVRYLNADDVVFGAIGDKRVTVAEAGVTPDEMTVEANGYVFSGGAISGRQLTISGPSGTAARFTNPIAFTSGAEVAANNELAFDYGNQPTTTSALSVSGEGGVAKYGAGQLTLTGASDYTGATRVLAGKLSLGAGADISDSLAIGGLAVSGGATFDVSGYGSLAIPNLTVVGGSNPAVIQTGTNSADFSGADITWIVPGAAEPGESLLEVGSAKVDGDTLFHLAYASTRPYVNLGESLVLLDAATLDSAGYTSKTATTREGDQYTVRLDPSDPGRLLATLSVLAHLGPDNERLKAYSEAGTASLAFVSEGQDLLISEGVPLAVSTTAAQGTAWKIFAGVQTGSSRYDTGSHVKVKGTTVLTGIAVGTDAGSGRFTVGAFFEGGWGDYDSHNSFARSADVNGDGDTSYAGGGLLARYDFIGGGADGLYLEASGRAGRQKVDFSTDDIVRDGVRGSFKTSGSYYGLHAGIGRKWQPGDADVLLDLGARLLWTRQEGADETLNLDRLRLHFDDANSLRLRAGGRVTFLTGGVVEPYFGAYFEHEFDGEVKATANGNPIEAPSLKGNTGIFELGMLLRPSDGPLSVNIGVQGYAGRRQGISGGIGVKYEF
ncbi:MAG: hypothetical protein LBR80_07400 [Deltaproteobacteria bacterium]|jgi:autotransporter-associated beta strand protein|nr:hypothetical protein [Deltaproteobacteria bacterium]